MNVGQCVGGLLLVLALSPGVSPTAAATTVEFETDSFKATVGVDSSADAGTLEVTRKIDGAAPEIRTLPPSVRHVDDVRVTHGKLLVVGRTNQGNDLLVIFDLTSLDLLDEILCRDLVLSPSARFAVFERFFPRFGTPERHSQHMTLLYDVSATAEQNRLETPDTSFDVGHPIYPRVPSTESRPYLLPLTAVREQKDRDHIPAYAWSYDERRIAFVVHRRTGQWWETKLIVVRIGDDGRPVSGEAIDVVNDFRAPFTDLSIADDSIRLARGSGSRKLIRVISRE